MTQTSGINSANQPGGLGTSSIFSDLLRSAGSLLGLDRSPFAQLLASQGALDRFGTAPGSTYIVKSGDTLSEIAQRHGTDWQTLARLNPGIEPNLIHPGDAIRLPSGRSATHVVQRGDTLGAIAAANGTTISQLLVNNPEIRNANLIYPGQEIRIGAGAARPANGGTIAGQPTPSPTEGQTARPGGGTHRLGSLSEVYESGNRGPGTVSSGRGDPGGVSYGVYQLSSRAGTLASFMRNEGQRWAGEFAGMSPGSQAYNDQWRAIAAREPGAFRDAQHAFIERTHYQPAVAAVQDRNGLNLDSRSNAVRDATWSVSVQHGGTATILNRAVAATDAQLARTDAGYDRALINNIYAERTSYVLNVARTNGSLSANERAQLISITENRYPAELRDALRMLDSDGATPAAPSPDEPAAPASGTIDGNAVARQNGVEVKSNSVRISELDARMGSVIAAVAQAARTLGLPTPVITSGNDSRHSNGSLHYANQALDFRGNNISIAQGQRFEAEVRRILGSDYFVDFETFNNSSNNHLHVEFDPN